MTGRGSRLSGLVCEDDPAIGRAIVVAMRRCGFQLISVVATGREAVGSAARAQPQAAVIDLALAGARGLGLVGDVVRAAPGCNVVVVSPLPALRSRALAAGAFAICELSDLRQLQLCLQHALKHTVGSSDDCDCHPVAGLEPSASVTRSLRPTTSAASYAASYRPWPSN